MIFREDNVDELFKKSPHRRKMDVRQIKLSKIVSKATTVTPDISMIKAREIILQKKVKRVIVVDKKKPIGIITEKDIAKKIYELKNKSMRSVKAKDFKPRKLFILTKENNVQECAKIMKKNRISLVLILNKNKILEGIVTKTDLVKAYLTKDREPLKVSKIMKKQLITATPSDPILYIESLLLKYGISRIIIKRNQKPVGVVTYRDFVPAKIPQWIAESADPKEIHEYKFKKGLEENQANQMSYLFPFHATDIMTENPITIEADEDIKSAITQMIKYNISGMPVIKKSKLVGIVTKSDIVNSLAV